SGRQAARTDRPWTPGPAWRSRPRPGPPAAWIPWPRPAWPAAPGSREPDRGRSRGEWSRTRGGGCGPASAGRGDRARPGTWQPPDRFDLAGPRGKLYGHEPPIQRPGAMSWQAPQASVAG